METNDDINILEFGDKNFNINLNEIDLFSLILKSIPIASDKISLNINNKVYIFNITELSAGEIYKIGYLEKTFILIKPIFVQFQNKSLIIKHYICFYEKLIYLLEKYKFINPYIKIKKIKIKINMDLNISDQDKAKTISILEKTKDKIIFSEILIPPIIDENSFKKNKIVDKIDKRFDIFYPNYFGNYFKEYISNINLDKSLIYSHNDNSSQFLFETEYNDCNSTFRFLTGHDKIGKTFYALCQNKSKNNHIYFNLKKIYEIEKMKNYDKINQIFFYEISKYFKNYEDYKVFSEEFFKKHYTIFFSSYKFIDILLKFIESIEEFMKTKNEVYPDLMISLDEVEMDEQSKEIFDLNYSLINNLYKKRNTAESKIHFSIISPINENYIKKCILLGLKLFYKDSKNEYSFFEEDKNGIIYYAYMFFPNLFYSNENEFKQYISKVKERNINNIPDKYLSLLNYSLYHLYNFESIYSKEIDNNNKIREIEKYIEEKKEEANAITLSFYEDENKIYKFDLDKLKEYNNIIGKGIGIDKLIDLLPFFPIKLITFQDEDERDMSIIDLKKFKVTYIYPIYENCISTYINQYSYPDYNENNKFKPGQKGDILEEKVIEAIKNGYFHNFQPDHIIEVNSIMNFSKKKSLAEYNKFININNYNLIMIIQSNPCGEKYDMAFLQKIDSKTYQFILSQISRKKKKINMQKYKTVKNDSYNFANFFQDPNININVIQYHFIFIFQAGLQEDIKSMQFCQDNRIKYLKFCIKDHKPIFSNSSNYIITSLIFNNQSFSLVDLIKSDDNFIENNNYDISNEEDNSSEYSLTGHKRQKIDNISKTKYFFGSDIYDKIKNIIGLDFELDDENYSLEENKYFYVYYKLMEKEKKNSYYLKYLFKGNEIIVDVLNNKVLKNQKGQELIKTPGFKSKCLLMISKNKKEKVS